MNALFVCGRNRMRSPTAAEVFSAYPGVETDSAGLNRNAEVCLSADQVLWADAIFVMERRQRAKLSQRFRSELRGKRLICLDIPDIYAFMQPELVALLEAKAGPHMRRG